MSRLEPRSPAAGIRVITGVRRNGETTPHPQRVAVEEPLEIRVGDVPIAVTMRTPGDAADLVRGFLLTEGMILSPAELAGFETSDRPGESRITVRLAAGIEIDPHRFQRNLFVSSSCGVCGKATIDNVKLFARRPAPFSMSPATLGGLTGLLRPHQPAFDETGGLHAAGIFSPQGDLIAVHEDVGRHNAVDKAIGAAALNAWPLPAAVLVVSGRQSFEIVQKAAMAKMSLAKVNPKALERGLPHLEHHVKNVQQFGVPVVVALNRFLTDTPAELELVHDHAAKLGVQVVLSDMWARGGAGGEELAREVLALLAGKTAAYRPLYRVVGSDQAEDRDDRQEGVRGRRRGLFAGRRTGDRLPRVHRAGEHAGVHGQDPILADGRSRAAGAPDRIPRNHQRAIRFGGRRLRGGQDGRHHDDARPAQGAGGRKDGDPAERGDRGPVLASGTPSPLKFVAEWCI
ncbi:MAG: formate--tetrahydrofolate ligase [Gemmatimonadetes bacterium]|nr:formate--tetrahydrofolate ligase [Gemmatimonadota bacterium]